MNHVFFPHEWYEEHPSDYYLPYPSPRGSELGLGETFALPGQLPPGIQRIYRVVAVDAGGYECEAVSC